MNIVFKVSSSQLDEYHVEFEQSSTDREPFFDPILNVAPSDSTDFDEWISSSDETSSKESSEGSPSDLSIEDQPLILELNDRPKTSKASASFYLDETVSFFLNKMAESNKNSISKKEQLSELASA